MANEYSFAKEFADSFLVGVALNEEHTNGQDNRINSLVEKHFNASTAENVMKWEVMQPAEARFDFRASDKFVSYSKNKGLSITGHTLVWHQQTPDWVFVGPDGKPASRQLLLSRMELHIKTVMGRYKGIINSWDVVNEALDEDGALRDSKWRRIIGDDYIAKAFEFATAADPDAELYYNDYNLFKRTKRNGAVRLIRSLLEEGIRVKGIGMQAHYALDYPNDVNEIAASIKAFSSLGLAVAITELDVSVLSFPEGEEAGADIGINLSLSEKLNPYSRGLPANVRKRFEKRYLELFEVFIENHEAISRVTFWGVHDGYSWRNNWPMRGRTDYPLVFDRKGKPKPLLKKLIWLKNKKRR
ncbi:MAG: endo-1,4-beta-xylanase [Pyrinomonadaceae bacterium]|nr:endo-1,4-beta-xylanase [Pyrinomonadaceae bacterium]